MPGAPVEGREGRVCRQRRGGVEARAAEEAPWPLEGQKPGGIGRRISVSMRSIGVTPGDRLDLERRQAVRVRAGEPAIEIDGAAAHPAHGLHDVEPRVGRLDDDERLPGAKRVEDADDFDVEALRLRPVEDGEAVPLHSLLHLAHADGAGLGVAAGQRDARAERHDDRGGQRTEQSRRISHGGQCRPGPRRVQTADGGSGSARGPSPNAGILLTGSRLTP